MLLQRASLHISRDFTVRTSACLLAYQLIHCYTGESWNFNKT